MLRKNENLCYSSKIAGIIIFYKTFISKKLGQRFEHFRYNRLFEFPICPEKKKNKTGPFPPTPVILDLNY